jgi:O-antigen biosynthesis protein
MIDGQARAPNSVTSPSDSRVGAVSSRSGHPVADIREGLRALGHRGLLGGLRLAWRRFGWKTDPFRLLTPTDQRSDQAGGSKSIRWLPPVRLGGETHHALLMNPDAAITYHVPASPGSRIVAQCGLLPGTRTSSPAVVEFELHVECPDSDWKARRVLVIGPGPRRGPSRWRRLVVRLPEVPGHDVVVRLATRVPTGASQAVSGSIWGEPRVEQPRSAEERRALVVGLIARFRRAGVARTVRQIRELPAVDEHEVRYRRWVTLNTPTRDDLAASAARVSELAWRPLISVLTPVYNTDARWLRACVESVRRQVYPNWELCLADDGSTNAQTLGVLDEYARESRIRILHLSGNSGISSATNAALSVATGEFVALLDHDDELAPEALFEVASLLNDDRETDFIYSDEDKLDGDGQRCDPHFKPDWSPEHLRSTMYTCHLMVLRTGLARELGGFRRGLEGAQDYDLALRVSERTTRIRHIPKVLYHWRKIPHSTASTSLAKTWAIDAGARALTDHVDRSGLDATVVPGPAPGLYRVRHRIAGQPLVSIVIPTRGGTAAESPTTRALTNCVRSIVEKSTYQHYEIVVAEDSPVSAATRELLEAGPHRRIPYHWTGSFNYPHKLNTAAASCRGKHLVLFNDDIEVVAPEWIEAMLEFSQQDGIGAVGARLIYPDGRLQHVGVLIGVCGMAAHAFHSCPGNTPGHGASAWIVRNYSAVTAACMMTRHDLYDRMHGFDERFGTDFNDTDYCLRLRREGYRIVYTPYAELCHLESVSYGARTWNTADLTTMRREWADVYARDPYYNPNLSRDDPDYRVRL